MYKTELPPHERILDQPMGFRQAIHHKAAPLTTRSWVALKCWSKTSVSAASRRRERWGRREMSSGIFSSTDTPQKTRKNVLFSYGGKKKMEISVKLFKTVPQRNHNIMCTFWRFTDSQMIKYLNVRSTKCKPSTLTNHIIVVRPQTREG